MRAVRGGDASRLRRARSPVGECVRAGTDAFSAKCTHALHFRRRTSPTARKCANFFVRRARRATRCAACAVRADARAEVFGTVDGDVRAAAAERSRCAAHRCRRPVDPSRRCVPIAPFRSIRRGRSAFVDPSSSLRLRFVSGPSPVRRYRPLCIDSSVRMGAPIRSLRCARPGHRAPKRRDEAADRTAQACPMRAARAGSAPALARRRVRAAPGSTNENTAPGAVSGGGRADGAGPGWTNTAPGAVFVRAEAAAARTVCGRRGPDFSARRLRAVRRSRPGPAVRPVRLRRPRPGSRTASLRRRRLR